MSRPPRDPPSGLSPLVAAAAVALAAALFLPSLAGGTEAGRAEAVCPVEARVPQREAPSLSPRT